MAKYDPLRVYLMLHDHLMQYGEREFEMTFMEIESVLGAALPPSSHRRNWWANRSSPQVHGSAWRAAGYDASLIADADRVKFRKVTAR